MPTEITIDASGRLVIPKRVRRRHHLSAGARLTLVEDGDRLVLVPRSGEPVTVERSGLLVFRGELAGEVSDARKLREERLDHLMGDG